MTDAAEPGSLSASRLHAALLDYFGAPGKYQLTLRQPALLFASVREILQVAAGRGQLDALPPAEAGALREAAGFFVRAALLYPGADHYAVFGLTPGAEPVELKERYRLLMRLTHPDFANSASAHWSEDAATRVNRAYETLSSPVLRRAYDEQLAAATRPARAAEPRKPDLRHPPQQVRRAEAVGWRVNPTAAWALVFGIGLLLVMFLFPAQETGHLVQKTPPSQARNWDQVTAGERAAAATATPLRSSEALATSSAPETTTTAVVAALPVPEPAAAAAPPAAPTAPPAQVAAMPRPPSTAPEPARSASPTATAMPTPVPVARAAVAPAPATRGPSAAELAANYRRSLLAAPSPVPPSAPVPPALPPAPVAAAPVVPPASVHPPAAVVAPPSVRAAAATSIPPSLNDAQPLLTQMLQVLESGSGDQLLRLLDGESRQTASAQALSRHYEQLVRGARPVRLTQVEFRSEARDGVLHVTGRIRLHAGEPNIGSHGERLLVRAEFVSRGGKVLLTGLSGAQD